MYMCACTYHLCSFLLLEDPSQPSDRTSCVNGASCSFGAAASLGPILLVSPGSSGAPPWQRGRGVMCSGVVMCAHGRHIVWLKRISVASLLLVAMPGAPSSFLFRVVVRPGAPSSVLAPSSDAEVQGPVRLVGLSNTLEVPRNSPHLESRKSLLWISGVPQGRRPVDHRPTRRFFFFFRNGGSRCHGGVPTIATLSVQSKP